MATTSYIAGGAPSGLNNVIIRATLQDAPAVSKTTTLTVGNQALFITLATGPEILKVDPNKYQKDYLALVTDATGSPVAGAVVTATVTPIYYRKGYYDNSNGKNWVQINTLSTALATDPIDVACTNEDGITHNPLYDYNGVLDAGEDQNRNSLLDPGNVASVTAAATDSTGHSTVSIVYARDYAYWVRVKLEVRANLSGSTASAVQYFYLQGAAADYTSLTVSPPGNPSPFGSNATCYAALTVMRLSDTKIALRWEPSADAVSYNIYRYPNGTIIASTTKTSYEDQAVAATTTYCYEVWQVDASGVEKPLSEHGNRVCVAPLSGGLVPPTGVTATPLSDTQIQVSWGDAGAAAYRVYKDGIPVLPDSVTRTVVITGLTANTRYCFAVSSLDASNNESARSATVCATSKLAAPKKPTVVKPTDPAVTTQLIVRWEGVPGAASYRVYRNGALRYTVAATTVQVVDAGLTSNTWYCYTISAVDDAGSESAQSEQGCEATNP
jgi:fibronectin type 3 domain-containing protein